MTVPGVVDFYGDFRIGGPVDTVCGFNRYLGFATTNNSADLDQIYALDVDPAKTDHYLFDGTSVQLTRELVTVEYKNGDGLSSETREFWSAPLGPVIYRGNGKIYIVKEAADGEFRRGEQQLHMMRARSLAEWKDAMKLRARPRSNFTYADRAGNVFYLWNASLPVLPHAVVEFCHRASQDRPDVRLQAHAGNGIVVGHVERDLTLEQAKEMLVRLHEISGTAQGNVVIQHCPAAWKKTLPVWGRARGPLYRTEG